MEEKNKSMAHFVVVVVCVCVFFFHHSPTLEVNF